MKNTIKIMKKWLVVLIASSVMMLCSAGCMGCKTCNGDDGKPVAPETYSNETGQTGEPSLPYMKPWWKQ